MAKFQGQFPRIPAPIVRRIYKLVDEGLSYREVSERVGCHRQSVYRLVKLRNADPSLSLTIRLRRPVERLRKQGKSYDAISRELGCSRSVVRDCVKRWGIELPRQSEPVPRRPRGAPVDAATEAAMVRLLKIGVSQRQVALRFGYSPDRVSGIAKAHGCEVRRYCPAGLSESEIIKLHELLEAGLTYCQIGSRLRLSETTIAEHANRLGIRRRLPRISEAKLVRLDELVEQGLNQREIAEELNVSPAAVSIHVRKRAASRGEDVPTKLRLSPVKLAELLERYDRGESMASIGRALGIGDGVVRRRILQRDAEIGEVIAGEPNSVPPSTRCPGCGAIVEMPCRVCEVRKAATGYAAQASGSDQLTRHGGASDE